jgi:excisionase family DNA binding protein
MAKRPSSHSLVKRPPVSAGEQLVVAEAVATILGVSRDRVWAMVRSEMIPFVRIGKRHIRFAPSKIRLWIENGGLIERKKA